MSICELKKKFSKNKKKEKETKNRLSFGTKYSKLIEKKLEGIIQETIHDDEIEIDEETQQKIDAMMGKLYESTGRTV